MKRTPLMLCLFTVAALAACGSDGGAAISTSAPAVATTLAADPPSPQLGAGSTQPDAPPTTFPETVPEIAPEPPPPEPVPEVVPETRDPGPSIQVAQAAPPVVSTGGGCGGDLPPCSVFQRESGGGVNNYNPTGCDGRGCYTQWQFDPRTWAGVAADHPELHLPAHPADATYDQADQAAAALWAGGRGCSHWDAC